MIRTDRQNDRSGSRPDRRPTAHALRRGASARTGQGTGSGGVRSSEVSARDLAEALPDRSTEGRAEERLAFAWVHDEQHLERAIRELSDLLGFLNGRDAGEGTTRLLGIWVGNQLGVPDPPVHKVFADGAVRIGDSAGIGGVWTLCWLRDEDVSAQDVVDALGEAYGEGPPSRFVPVLPDDGRRQRGVAPESVWNGARSDTVGSHPVSARPVHAIVQDLRTGRLKDSIA